MNRVVTTAIVLKRTNFGEADRIITCITPDHGKVRLMAKGVRKNTSKLAGGIELLSSNSITFIPGKKDIGTLVSSRLQTYFDAIVKDINRTMVAYELLKTIDKTTQDNCESAFFGLLHESLAALNEPALSLALVEGWFYLRLLMLHGHSPNLDEDENGQKLVAGQTYGFDYDAGAFTRANNSSQNNFTEAHIKLLRLMQAHTPQKLQNVQRADELLGQITPFLKSWARYTIQ